MNFITAEQAGGIVRALVASGASYAIAKGYVTPAYAEWMSAGAVGLFVAGWSWWAKRPA